MAASRKVTEDIARRIGLLVRSAEHRQDAGNGKVIYIVASHLRIFSRSPEAGHAAYDESRVQSEEEFGIETELFKDAGAEGLDEYINISD